MLPSINPVPPIHKLLILTLLIAFSFLIKVSACSLAKILHKSSSFLRFSQLSKALDISSRVTFVSCMELFSIFWSISYNFL